MLWSAPSVDLTYARRSFFFTGSSMSLHLLDPVAEGTLDIPNVGNQTF